MPMTLYPKCWRGRDDCEPIHCIEGTDEKLTDAQITTLNYDCESFVCSGCVKDPDPVRDQYRLCFKNSDTDEMSDNDLQDLTAIVSVISAALLLDNVRKTNNGIIEIPAEEQKEDGNL